jgi:valyl-tRNA synthetase
LDVAKVVSSSYFNNKLWNAVKFTLNHMHTHNHPIVLGPDGFPSLVTSDLTLFDRFILSRLAQTVSTVQKAFDSFALFKGVHAIHNFLMDDFCGVYLESIKPALATPGASDNTRAHLATLGVCLDTLLRLSHPFIPFITEVIKSLQL